MREIKFRVWNKLIKRMSLVKRIDFQRNNLYTIYAKNSGGTSPTNFELMQFTGLKDKNGKEIYEGDVFDCIYKNEGCNHKLIIIWDEDNVRFKVKNSGECQQSGVHQSLSDVEREEVIGNIYENPELLERQK